LGNFQAPARAARAGNWRSSFCDVAICSLVTRSALRRISIKLLRSARMEDRSLASMKRSRSRALSPSPKGASTVPLINSGSPLVRP
jgi:hypothetical protein